MTGLKVELNHAGLGHSVGVHHVVDDEVEAHAGHVEFVQLGRRARPVAADHARC